MLRNWGLFKTKWNMPLDQALEQGYRMPASAPDGVALKISLPDLAKSHQTETPAGFWTERAVEKAPLQPISPKVNVTLLLPPLRQARPRSRVWAA